MKNKINIVEILKDAPRGTKLYSPIFGECVLEEEVCLEEGRFLPIVVTVISDEGIMDTQMFTKYGYFSPAYYDNAECMLFPSKECLTWENFKAPWKHDHKVFEPFQEVLVPKCCHFGVGTKVIWAAAIYSHYDEDNGEHVTTQYNFFEDYQILPYKGNEEKLGKEYEKED